MLYANVKSSIADGKECAPLFISLLYGVGQSQSPRSGHKKNAEFVEWLLRGDGHGRFVCLRPTTRVIPVDLAFYCVEFETQSLLSCIVDSILIQVNSKVFLILPLITDVVQSQFICVIHAAMGCKDMMLLSDCATREEERG